MFPHSRKASAAARACAALLALAAAAPSFAAAPAGGIAPEAPSPAVYAVRFVSDHGTVDTNALEYAAGTVLRVRATPHKERAFWKSWRFSHWAGDVTAGQRDARTLELTVAGPREIRAVYVPEALCMALDLGRGLLVSAEIFFLTLLFALPIGLLVAFGRMSKWALPRQAARIYVSIMRGTPLMLQLFFFYFGPYYAFGVSSGENYRFVACIIAFSLNYAAYFAEIYRAGIESMPLGQYEAAKMLGFTRAQTFFRIILPQVVKRILPPVTNEVITLVKDTSLAFTLSVMEMFTVAKMAASAHTTMLPFIVAGAFYYLFNYLVAWGMERVEKKLSYYR